MESTWAILPQVAVERAQCPPRLAGIEVLIVGIGLCCEKYFRAQRVTDGSSSGSDLKERGDELRLPYRVSTAQPLHLSLPHHVQSFDAFYCPLRGVKVSGSMEAADSTP